jgi:hypothetical protein
VAVALDILATQKKDAKYLVNRKLSEVQIKWTDAVIEELLQLTASGKQPQEVDPSNNPISF